MAINTQIAKTEWLNFFATFSNGNRGRTVTIETFDAESGSTGQTGQGKLLGASYDPAGKGDDIVITTGTNEVDYAHEVHSPTQVWRVQSDDGAIAALELVDHLGHKTVLSLGRR